MKIFNRIENFLRDSKTEVLTFVSLLFILNSFPNCTIVKRLMFYELNEITTLIGIIIGLYLAVISIIATATIPISRKMIESKLDNRIINVIEIGIFENLIVLVLYILKFYGYGIFNALVMCVIISFVKFIFLLINLLRANFTTMAEEIDRKDELEQDFLVVMSNINKNLEKIKKQNEQK